MEKILDFEKLLKACIIEQESNNELRNIEINYLEEHIEVYKKRTKKLQDLLKEKKQDK